MKLSNFIPSVAVAFCLAGMVACSGNKSADNGTSTETDTVSAPAPEVQDSAATAAATASASDYAVKVFGPEDKLVPGAKPIVVDFSATWCGPCQRFKPIFHNVGALYADKADFATADVDECNELAAAYDVQSIPFVLIVNPDGSKASNTGLMTEDEFKAFLDKNLKPAK